MKIELCLKKEVNFLIILYQKLKGQQNFENLQFSFPKKIEKNSCKKEIKKMLRESKFSFEEIKENPFLKEFYLKNIPIFEAYWQENLKKLELIKRNLESKISSFDLDLFNKVGNFFSKNPPEKIKIWICMGNETVFGSGNAFSPNLAVVFPRKFRGFDEKSLKNDFAVLIH